MSSEASTLPLPMASSPSLDFAALYRQEFAYVWHTLRRLGIRSADLPDVTHDVFVTVHRRLDSFESGRPVRPWLFGIAYRVAADHVRLARNAREVAHDAIEVADPAVPADEHVANTQDQQLVREALAALDLDKRAVLIMHDIDGHAMPEIAQTLGAPLKTCYSRLRAAREEFVAAVRRLRLIRGER